MDDEGVLWIGSSSGGLNRVQDGKITSYTPDQGLFDSTVGNILEDKFGNLWMGSDKGIFRVAKSELNDFAGGRTSAIHGVVYDTMDGLRSRETMQGGTGTASKGPDGRLWFSTMKGLSVVDPARALGDDHPLHAQIEEVLIDGKAADAAPGHPRGCAREPAGDPIHGTQLYCAESEFNSAICWKDSTITGVRRRHADQPITRICRRAAIAFWWRPAATAANGAAMPSR